MRNISFSIIILLALFFFIIQPVSAQMMNTSIMQEQISITPSIQDVQDIQKGKDLYTQLQTKQLSCTNLEDQDFEKIGEYLMNQQFAGDVNWHIQMNARAKQIMGEQGEGQMHVILARNLTGCNINQKGGAIPMMGWYGASGMMGGWGYGFGILWVIGYVIVLIDLILAGMWLWKQVKKKK